MVIFTPRDDGEKFSTPWRCVMLYGQLDVHASVPWASVDSSQILVEFYTTKTPRFCLCFFLMYIYIYIIYIYYIIIYII